MRPIKFRTEAEAVAYRDEQRNRPSWSRDETCAKGCIVVLASGVAWLYPSGLAGNDAIVRGGRPKPPPAEGGLFDLDARAQAQFDF